MIGCQAGYKNNLIFVPRLFYLEKILKEIHKINYVSKYKPRDNSNTIEDNFD